MKPHVQINGYRLTVREHQVWKGLASGKPTKAIAAGLSCSPGAVFSYRKRLYAKIGVNCTASATLEAVRHGVVEVEVLK